MYIRIAVAIHIFQKIDIYTSNYIFTRVYSTINIHKPNNSSTSCPRHGKALLRRGLLSLRQVVPRHVLDAAGTTWDVPTILRWVKRCQKL